jgi:hypothetical protein
VLRLAAVTGASVDGERNPLATGSGTYARDRWETTPMVPGTGAGQVRWFVGASTRASNGELPQLQLQPRANGTPGRARPTDRRVKQQASNRSGFHAEMMRDGDDAC